MSAINRHLDGKRDALIAVADKAIRHANANVADKAAQQAANLAGDAAQEARRLADKARFNRHAD